MTERNRGKIKRKRRNKNNVGGLDGCKRETAKTGRGAGMGGGRCVMGTAKARRGRGNMVHEREASSMDGTYAD